MNTPKSSIRDKVWQRRVVAELGVLPQPAFAAVNGTRIEPGNSDLAETLLQSPGSYILKPRYGSNGFCVARIVSSNGDLTVESDCPDTAAYLEEFPQQPELHGRDLVEAVACHRRRFVDRARVGLSESVLDQSILEAEIPQHRAEGSIFEPRIVVQRVKCGAGDSFATLGAICKRIDTAISASVVRDFREEPLEVSLRRFLAERVPAGNAEQVTREARSELLSIGEQMRTALVPFMEARGAQIHQFGIDCRLCWNAERGRVEYPFLEFQFGIGRIDPALGTEPLPGYRTRAELTELFGREVG